MAATASHDFTDGPVMSVINKRIRALRKKLNRIQHTEETLSQGKPINKEQEEVLRSKPFVLSLIDELEKLRQPLSSALTEELNLALTPHLHHQQQQQTLEPANSSPTQPEPEPERNSNDAVHILEDLLNLLYFGSLFDVKSQSDFASMMLTRTHERGCCLTYDYVTDDATDLLREKDLDLIAAMRGLLISRPADSSLSHKNALQRCIEHAKLWLASAEQPIEPNADVTYAGLRERLNKIMSSEYFTTTPEMKATVEVAAAAAAAAGNYSSFQVAEDSVEVEGSDSLSQEKDEGTANFQGHGSGDDQSDPEGEHQNDEVEAENAVEVVSVQHEQTAPLVDVEHHQQDVEAKEQHYPRRGYQNQRGGRGGGGRRGYSNGRGGRGGGRGYQNGCNQYYDQPGNYYPRNYHNNRGRGGGRGGGYSYNNHGAGGQMDHVASDVGVQSY